VPKRQNKKRTWKGKKNEKRKKIVAKMFGHFLYIYSELATLVLNEEEKKKDKFITMVWQ